MATYGHNQHVMKYSHDGYPGKEHGKCCTPVKESIDLGVWLKSYGKNKNLDFSFVAMANSELNITLNFEVTKNFLMLILNDLTVRHTPPFTELLGP